MANKVEQADLASLWKVALVDYETEAEHALSESALAAAQKVHTPEDFLSQIEASGKEFKDFRNRRAGLWHRLSAFVAPLTSLLKIAVTPSSVSDSFGAPASAAIGACLYLVRVCEQVSDAYGWIEEVFSELQDFSDRLTLYLRSRIDVVLQRKIVAILGFLLRVIGRSEYLIKKGRFRHYLKIAFLAKDEKTKALIGELNKMFESEQRYVLAATYDKSQSIEEKVDSNAAQIKEIHQTQLDAETDERIWRTLCNTSATDDIEEIFSRQKRGLLKGTGVWLQNEKPFEEWFEGQTTLLWIFGGPGAGKSYLSTWLVQRLQTHPGRRKGQTATAYFFVKENSEILRETNNILKTIAWQLTSQDPNFKLHVAEISKDRALTITAEDTWENIFLAYYESASPAIYPAAIVLDGLDEAPPPTRKELLSLLKNLSSLSHSSTPPPIQFAIVGRTSLRHDLEFSRHQRGSYIEVSKYKNHADMTRYICKRLEDVELLRTLRKTKGVKRANKVGVQLRDKILEGADGVFLWAKLLIDTIVHKDLIQIEAILNDPPANLDDMICSVFERLEKDEDLDQELVVRMVALCGYARRPLRFGELDLFLSLPGQKTRYLLWAHVRGKLSSVFECAFPVGYDPDKDENSDTEQDRAEATSQNSADGITSNDGTDGGEFDFSGNADDDGDEDDDEGDEDDGDINTDAVVTGESTSWSLNPSSEGSIGAHLSAGQRGTVITFSHTRFKDYVVREGHPRTRKKPLCAVIPDSERVQAQLLIMCLDVFRLGLFPNQTPGTSDAEYLAEYPLRNLVWHLKETDKASISAEEYCRVVEGLHWIFGTEQGAECHIKANHYYDDWHSTYNEFWHTWVSTKDNISVVQEWFANLQHRDTNSLELTEQERGWVVNAAKDLQVLLQRCMMKASKLWLVRDGHDSVKVFNKGEWPCWLLYGWHSLINNPSLPSLVADFDAAYDMYDFYSVPGGHLETLAEWAGLEQNQHWHTMLGCILCNASEYEMAKAHGIEAVKQDPGSWVAMEVIARASGKLSKFADAIHWMKKSIETIPSSIADIAGYMWPSVYDWATSLGDEPAAFEAAKTGAELNYTSMQAQTRYIKALHARGDSETIIRTISRLREVTYPTKPFNQVVNMFVDGQNVYDEIGKAIRDTGPLVWVLDDLQKALQHLEKHEQSPSLIITALNAANFSDHWYDDQEDRTIEWAELFLSRLAQEESAQYLSIIAGWPVYWTAKLAQLYFDKATLLYRDTGDVTSEVSSYAEKLKALALSEKPRLTLLGQLLPNHAALLWGRWLKEYRNADKSAWQKDSKDTLIRGFKVLIGAGSKHRIDHLLGIGQILLKAGDRKNASTLFAALHKPLGKRGTKPTEREEKESGHISDLQREQQIIVTHGRGITLSLALNTVERRCSNCKKLTLEAAGFYFCEICPDERWCDICLAMVRDPTIKPGLERHRCNPTHPVYRVWPVPDEIGDIAGEYREESGQFTLKATWLDRVGSDWSCRLELEEIVASLLVAIEEET